MTPGCPRDIRPENFLNAGWCIAQRSAKTMKVRSVIWAGHACTSKSNESPKNVEPLESLEKRQEHAKKASGIAKKSKEIRETKGLGARADTPAKTQKSSLISKEKGNKAEYLQSLNSLESLENGQILLILPHSGDFLDLPPGLYDCRILHSLESLENVRSF